MAASIGLVGGIVGSIVASALHFAAHTYAGEQSAFENAGVTEAGISVALFGFVLGYLAATGQFQELVEWIATELPGSWIE